MARIIVRRPTQTDVEKLYAFHENKQNVFPGLIGSNRLYKWPWASCPLISISCSISSRGDSGRVRFILLEGGFAITRFMEFGKLLLWCLQELVVLMKSISQPGLNDVKRIRYNTCLIIKIRFAKKKKGNLSDFFSGGTTVDEADPAMEDVHMYSSNVT
ncbi:hypothetical protein Tco_0780572 [Tanacetum coccineum]